MSVRPARIFRVLAFESTHAALDAEALLDDLGFDVVPVPAPAGLTANCGIALRLEPDDAGRAITYLARAGIAVAAIADVEDV